MPCQPPPRLDPPSTLLAPLPPHTTPFFSPACRSSSYASLSTRQYANAFNLPLSLDTSSVSDMAYMFQVRLARTLPARLDPPSTLLAPLPPHATPSFRPHAAPFPSYASLLDSAVRGCVQPAAVLRHFQRHLHALHVLCALRACPATTSTVGPSQRTACAAAAPRPGPHVALFLCFPFDCGRVQTHCPPQTSSSSVVHGRAIPSLTIVSQMGFLEALGPAWVHAHRRRHQRRQRRPTLQVRRQGRRRTTANGSVTLKAT